MAFFGGAAELRTDRAMHTTKKPEFGSTEFRLFLAVMVGRGGPSPKAPEPAGSQLLRLGVMYGAGQGRLAQFVHGGNLVITVIGGGEVDELRAFGGAD